MNIDEKISGLKRRMKIHQKTAEYHLKKHLAELDEVRVIEELLELFLAQKEAHELIEKP